MKGFGVLGNRKTGLGENVHLLVRGSASVTSALTCPRECARGYFRIYQIGGEGAKSVCFMKKFLGH